MQEVDESESDPEVQLWRAQHWKPTSVGTLFARHFFEDWSWNESVDWMIQKCAHQWSWCILWSIFLTPIISIRVSHELFHEKVKQWSNQKAANASKTKVFGAPPLPHPVARPAKVANGWDWGNRWRHFCWTFLIVIFTMIYWDVKSQPGFQWPPGWHYTFTFYVIYTIYGTYK